MLDNLSWTLERARAEPAVLPAGWLGDEAAVGRVESWDFAGDRKLGLGARRMFAAKSGGGETCLVKGRVCRGWINVEGFAGERSAFRL